MKYRGDFEYVPFPEFVKSWESFAGKPYVKPGKNTGLRTRKTGVIRGTVRGAQELLCQLGKQVSEYEKWRTSDLGPDYDGLGHAYFYNTPAHQNWALGWWRTGMGVVVSEKPAGPPQSLGELCIELAQDSIRNAYYAVDVAWPGLCDSYPFRRDTSRDIQNLRTLMYHKHTDPEKERRTQRIESVVRLIKFVWAGGTQ